MGSFDYFSQLQGPVINTSLFSDAATAGINAGNALPTKTTSIIRGIQEGFHQGLKDTQALHEISQYPVQDQLQQEQLEAAQQTNDIRALQLQIASETQAQNLETAKVTAQNQLDDLRNQKEIADMLGSQDPNQRASVLNNPKYTGTLIRNKELAAATLQRLATDPNVSEATRQQALQLQDFDKRQQHELAVDKLAATIRKSIVGDEAKIMEDFKKSNLPDVFSGFGIDLNDPKTLREVLNLKTYQSGLKTYKSDGTIDTSAPDNDLTLPNIGFPGKYEIVYNGKKSNLILNDADQNALAGLKSYLIASGVRAPETPTSTPIVSVQPTSNSASGGSSLLGNIYNSVKSGVQQGVQAVSSVASGISLGTPPVAQATGVSPQPTPPSAEQITTVSQDAVVARQRAALEAKAASDPELKNRLIAKGKLAGTPVATPTGPQVGAVPAPTPPATAEIVGGGGSGGGGAGGEAVPVVTNKATVEGVYSTLTPAAKKHVSIDVLDRVVKEPLVSKLSPLEQAIVAVESGGKRNAKAKGSSATGLFQLTDAAAKTAKVNKNNPADNVKGGVAYFNQIKNLFGGNEIAALMGYYLGPSVVGEAIQTVNSAAYEDVLYGLDYLKSKGRFIKTLTEPKLAEVAKYPFKVLAYKEAFEALAGGRRKY